MKANRYLFILCSFFVMLPLNSLAGDAQVLPKGNFAFNIDYKHYFPWDEWYDSDGDVQDAASDFNTILDSNVFPALRAFDGVVPGVPNVGSTITSFEYTYDRIDTSLAYGVTDKLSIGIKIPYIRYKNKVKATVDTTNANLGKNNLYKLGVLPPEYDAAPVLPLGTPGLPEGAVTPFSDEDVQSLLGNGLEINGVTAIPGYGFDRFETWEKSGIGDIEAGLKYRYFQNENWRLAGLFGIIFPTGVGHDPDSLQAEQLGGDFYSLEFRSYNDYIGIDNLIINASFFYSWNLEYDSKRRIVDDPHSPLSYTKEKVNIDPGDLIEFETSIAYQFDEQSPLHGASLQLLYNYTKGFKDDVSGPGPDSLYKGLEIESDGMEQEYIVSIGYSTIPLFLKKEFPVPMDLSLSYRNKFAGENSTFKTEYLQAGMTIYF